MIDKSIAVSGAPMPQTLGNGTLSLSQTRRNGGAFLCAEYGCWPYMQKLSTAVSSSQMTAVWDCSPNRNLLLRLASHPLRGAIYNECAEFLGCYWCISVRIQGPLDPNFPPAFQLIPKSHGLEHNLSPMLLWVIPNQAPVICPQWTQQLTK